jgi:hypothetical protein
MEHAEAKAVVQEQVEEWLDLFDEDMNPKPGAVIPPQVQQWKASHEREKRVGAWLRLWVRPSLWLRSSLPSRSLSILICQTVGAGAGAGAGDWRRRSSLRLLSAPFLWRTRCGCCPSFLRTQLFLLAAASVVCRAGTAIERCCGGSCLRGNLQVRNALVVGGEVLMHNRSSSLIPWNDKNVYKLNLSSIHKLHKPCHSLANEAAQRDARHADGLLVNGVGYPQRITDERRGGVLIASALPKSWEEFPP